MKLDHLIFFRVAGCEIDAAAKPSYIDGFEITNVHVDGGDVGAPGMNHQAHSGREKFGAFGDLKLCCGTLRKGGAVNGGEVHTAFFNEIAFGPNACNAAAFAFFVFPAVFPVRNRIVLIQKGTNIVLYFFESVLYLCCIGHTLGGSCGYVA